MSLKKKPEVRTAKMVRELMLADEDVSASTIMVYSDNGTNVEIKIEGLHPRSNEELFLSGKVDWNRSVIYRTVDFTGKAEVGKVMLTEMKKNNVTLQIERVMWSKDKQEEQAAAEHDLAPAPVAPQEKKAEARTEFAVETPPAKAEKPAAPARPAAPVRLDTSQPAPAVQAVVSISKQEEPAPAQTATAASLQQADKRTAETDALQSKYERLLQHAKNVCTDYSLGMDVDDSIEALTGELQQQGVQFSLDGDVMEAVNKLRALKVKGIDPKKLLSLL